MSTLKKFVIFLAVLVIALPASAFGYVYFKLDAMHDSSADQEILGSEDYVSEKGITNILLIGTDGRTVEEEARSDAMMILTVDGKNKSLKLTSLARDTYVSIPGYGQQKLTHAYVYGGVNLLIDTLERNFELDIHNYASVNFFSFMDIVDALGGVTVDVKSSEIAELNKFINETYRMNTNPDKGRIEYVKGEGTHTLNGYQTLSFARIRKHDSALERDRRQRAVIQGMINGVKELPLTKYPKLIDTILPYVKTNMKPTQIMGLGTEVLNIGNLDIKQMEFPIDDGVHSTGGILGNAGWVLQFDPDSLDILHDFIFNDILPENNPKLQ